MGECQMAKKEKCYGCDILVDLAKAPLFIKCKNQRTRYYCEKCAKERGYHAKRKAAD
jgi:hypothetical protein